jgi:hypothetical protein
MKRQNDANNATRALQRAQREMIKGMEFFYDCLDSGKSIEELEIELEIAAAGGALSASSHEVWRGGLEIIRSAREQRSDRNEVINYLWERAKADTA